MIVDQNLCSIKKKRWPMFQWNEMELDQLPKALKMKWNKIFWCIDLLFQSLHKKPDISAYCMR